MKKTIYDHYLANPPVSPITGHPDRGSTARYGFWTGYNGGRAVGQPGSAARLAWKAGVKAKKDGNEKAIEAKEKLSRFKERVQLEFGKR